MMHGAYPRRSREQIREYSRGCRELTLRARSHASGSTCLCMRRWSLNVLAWNVREAFNPPACTSKTKSASMSEDVLCKPQVS